MRFLAAALAFFATLAVTALVAFSSVMFLAGPHGGVLPSSFQTAALVVGWLLVAIVPIAVARWVWHRLDRPNG
jgi:hypothetical protein